ncbi:MAG: DUF547 domain-containing protein [Saonia sp.]
MKKKSLVIMLLLSISLGYAQSTADFFSKSDTFFKANVKNGRVTYKVIKDNPAVLNELIEMAKGISVDTGNAMEYQAFWINGYNLSVIKGIIENYPLKSPLDIDGFFDRAKYDIGGESITLNDMEHQLLRGNFSKDPRFHFVLVCAGQGCPPIIDEAYTPSRLNSQLNRQTRKAMNDPDFIRVNKNKVKISQIFEWYKSDFEQDGKVTDFINRYKSEKLPEKVKVSYYPYDWTLNEVR